MDPADARRLAMIRFGNVSLTKEDTRAVWIWVWLDQLRHDGRYAFRTLRRNQGFAIAAVPTLAIGIGVNTALYTIVGATLLRPLPYKEPDRLMQVSLTIPSSADDDMFWSYPKYEAFRNVQDVFGDTAVYRSLGARTVTGRRATYSLFQ